MKKIEDLDDMEYIQDKFYKHSRPDILDPSIGRTKLIELREEGLVGEEGRSLIDLGTETEDTQNISKILKEEGF